jgi:hypothetical protein
MEPEIKAMAELFEALSPLNPEELRRVLKWANEKYLGKSTGPSAILDVPPPAAPVGPGSFGDIVELVDAARPGNGLDRILVAAYWFQVVQAHDDFDSQTLNTELKHMGYPSTNITRDLDSLMNRSPKLVIQTRKEGSSKQARKRFRLTREGIRAVDTMLRVPEGNAE